MGVGVKLACCLNVSTPDRQRWISTVPFSKAAVAILQRKVCLACLLIEGVHAITRRTDTAAPRAGWHASRRAAAAAWQRRPFVVYRC
jgi:hypothetical protein